MKGQSYSSMCGQVRGHASGDAFINTIICNYNLEQPYVTGVSLTCGPAERRRHIWTFAAARGDGDPRASYEKYSCGCSNTNMNWPYTTPDDVGHDYFCDNNEQFAGRFRLAPDEEGDLWDGKGCGSSSSCCEWNDPPYSCKHLHNTTSEDMEIRLFTGDLSFCRTSVSLIEIFVK